LKFGEALEILRAGGSVNRKAWMDGQIKPSQASGTTLKARIRKTRGDRIEKRA
jgi:hypothetical protein